MDQFMVSVQMFFQNLGQRLYDSFIYKDRYMYLVQGLGNTLLITLGAVLIGVILGTLVSLVRIVHSQNPKKLRFLNAISGLYLTVFRGTPMVVQLIIMYYIVFGAYRGNPLLVAVIAFGINSGAYVAEVVRSGIQSVDKGQTEAGRSLAQDARYIVQYCKDSVTRARNAAGREQEVLRIGTSPMTPAQVLVDLWPKIQEDCPGVKFQLVPYDNTPENAREILAHLGQNIDVVAGIFDETMLALRQCAALELSREPICCAVSVHHRLAAKDRLAVEDLYGERLMLIKRGWSRSVDRLREDLWKNHPQIQIVDFDFYNTEAFNQCENNNCVLMAMDYWRYVHPLMKILPVEWDYTIPFGLFHAPAPSPGVERFLKAVEKVVRS